MVITYLGEGCFRLQSGETSLLIDPSGNRLKSDVTIRTTVNPEEVISASDVVSFAGEYEIKGIEIEGVEVSAESTPKLVKTAYKITWEDITIGVLGAISNTPETKILEKIGEPDVLILPVDEDHFLEPEAAGGITRQFEPSVVIPSSYSKKSLEAFGKTLGQPTAVEERFTFKKKDLQPEAMKLVVLGAKS